MSIHNRFRRFCALMLAFVLVLGLFLQTMPGVALAEEADQEPTGSTQETTEPTTEPITEEPTTEPTQATTEPTQAATVPTEETAEPDVPESAFFRQLMDSQTAEQMYLLVLEDMNNNSAAQLNALTAEELSALTAHAQSFPEDAEGVTDRADLLDTLAQLSGQEVIDDAEPLIPEGYEDYIDLNKHYVEKGRALASGKYILTAPLTLTDIGNLRTDKESTVVIDLNGFVLTGNGAGSVITNRGTLTIDDASGNNSGGITGGNSTDIAGAAIASYANGGVLVTINGGTIYGNTSTGSVSGGAIAANNLVLNGGIIGDINTQVHWSDGTTTSYPDVNKNKHVYITRIESPKGNVNNGNGGGAIFVNKSLTMTGGIIVGNSSTATGGAIRLYTNAKAEFTGGCIYGNSAGSNGGGIYSGAGEITLGDEEEPKNVRIYCNKTGSYGGGIDTGAKIDIYEGIEIAYNTAVYNGGAMVVEKGCQCTIYNGMLYRNYAGTSATENNSGYGGAIRCVGKLTIKGGSIHENYANKYGGGISAQTDDSDGGRISNVALNGGVIRDNHAKLNGGGININSGATHSITVAFGGVEISGNSAEENGGGVGITVTNTGEIDLQFNNCKILDNEAQNGGGVYVSVAKTVTGTVQIKDGAQISNNAASADGGGLYCTNGQVNVLNASIAENEAKNGGGIYLANGNLSLDSENALIQKNKATNGAGVYLTGGVPNLYKGTISDNEATGNGGGIYINQQQVRLAPTGTVNITGNKAADGAGMYIGGTSTNLAGFSVDDAAEGTVTFTGNIASGNGGGVCLHYGNFSITKDNIPITGNEAQNGGGIAVLNGNVTLSDGAVTQNKATADGGGIYVADGDVEIIYSEIDNNSAKNGGGIFVSANSQAVNVNMLSGTLSSNTASNNGGGMAVDSQTGKNITVEIGCLLDHHGKPAGPDNIIAYTDAYQKYAPHKHTSCPQVVGNIAGKIGGGFYLNSEASSLSFYCIQEDGNIANGNDSCWGMDVEGGNVSIGDKIYHNKVVSPSGSPNGYVQMNSTILVNGGTVNIYGDMDNPFFAKEVTVDIKDVNDSFTDHRRGDQDYKIHYFENFDNTGIYKALQYDVVDGECLVDIKGVLFEHPGYEIIGWYTAPTYTGEDDPNNMFFQVGNTYNLTAEEYKKFMGLSECDCQVCKEAVTLRDHNLLVLYAIWEANGYKVIFAPNPPSGMTYSGKMEPQTLRYDAEEKLRKNEYVVSGYIFDGWKDGKGISYTDEQTVTNLTTEAGAEITLYAQWKLCEHPEPTYTVQNETIKRVCEICGKTWTASVWAEDVVYDGQPHGAEVITAGEPTDWLSSITYTPGSNSVPINAGTYTASISANGVSASVTYTIKKADQKAPVKPEYQETTVDGKTVLAINPIAASSESKAEAQYRVSYYSNGALQHTGWSNELNITLGQAWTNYYVEAYYPETDNYFASNISRADMTYFYSGDVKVIVECDPDILYQLIEAEQGAITDGLTLTLSYDDETHYLVGGKYTVTFEINMESKPNVEEVESGKYSITAIPSASELTITIGDARKKPGISVKAQEKQIFGQVTGDTTVYIAPDSAFTARFEITDFDRRIYSNPSLYCSPDVPSGTTVILLDRADNSYWYYRATGSVSSIPINSFTEMGGSETHPKPSDAQGDQESIDLSYQFIVDFSQSTGWSGSVSMALLPEKAETKAPSLSGSVSVQTSDVDFALKSVENEGLSATLAYQFTSSYAASKWDDRGSALVLTLDDSMELPADACLDVTVDGQNSVVYQQDNGSFIVPLGLLTTGEKSATLTLQSALFPEAGASYNFTAHWYISSSQESSAPYTGTSVQSANLIFTADEAATPSIKLTGTQRVLKAGSRLALNVQQLDLGNYAVKAALQRKSDTGAFVGTGWRTSVTADTTQLSIPLGGQSSGTYCVAVTYTKPGDTTILDEIRYYFVIE